MQVAAKDHLLDRMKDFKEKLVLISECRKKEMDKPYAQRNYRVLYMLHKDEALYKYCLAEFQNLLKMMA